MKRILAFAALLVILPGVAQAQTKTPPARGGGAPPTKTSQAPPRAQTPPVRPEVGGGHIPAKGPPSAGAGPKTPPAGRGAPTPAIRPTLADKTGHPEAPHVHAANDQWIGAATGRNDPNYKLAHPWEHGHFPGTIGAQQIWRLRGGARDHFSIGAYFFQVAPYDYPYCTDWLWDTDDIVLYPDPDHDGWYLAYNVRLGTFVHVMYLGT